MLFIFVLYDTPVCLYTIGRNGSGMALLSLVLDLCLVVDFLFHRSELCGSCLAILHYWEALKCGFIFILLAGSY
jgi:hypothetical protein